MSRYSLSVGVFLGLLAPSISSLAADRPPAQDPSDVPLVAEPVRQAMQDSNFTQARKAIDEAAQVPRAPSDYLAYLRAWSFQLDKQPEQAIAALEKFEKDFPQSTWLRRARFAKAQAMAAKGDFRGAQAIYEQEGKYLLSAARRQQAAAVYREFADTRFQPRHHDQQPEYGKAREFYALALETGIPAEQLADVKFRMATCSQKLAQHAEAAAEYENFLAAFTDDPRRMEAGYRLGECLFAEGKMAEARKAWREVAGKAPVAAGWDQRASASAGPPTPLVVGLRSRPAVHGNTTLPRGLVPPYKASFPPKGGATSADWPALAAFHLAETWHCPSPENDEDLRRGVAALEDFLARFPRHELAVSALLRISQSQLHRGHDDQAAATLVRFLSDPRWKDSKEAPQARQSLGQIYAKQKKYAEALSTWRAYMVRYPGQEGASVVQGWIVDTEYLAAVEKFALGDNAAAVKLLGEFMDRYPLDLRNPSILLLFGEIDQRQEKWEAAIAAWQKVIAKYPHSEAASHAQYLIGRTLADVLGRYDEAVEHYKQVTGHDADAAHGLIEVMAEKSLGVATERVFRSRETPQLKLSTRNVPAVKLRVYKIDLETYFRKMHSIAGIQRLDVSLIDPDAVLDFAVPAYVKCKSITSSIPVPLPEGLKAGVAAVTVSSATEEATTLVIQSDLEITVQSSRDEVLVFAENMATGRPWSKVRLLLSDGRSVFAEAVTGEDGTFRQRYAELKDTACLRVFAAAEGGHVASTAVQLAGQAGVRDLADKIYLQTDRRSYYAGEMVHVRGCARRAEGDHYAVEPGKRLSVEVLGDLDHRLRREQVTLSAMGTFAWDFRLPAGMPEAGYQVVVRDQAGHRQTADFQIDRPEEQRLHLTLDLPRTVFYRDEVIEGTLRAMLPEDRPLVGVKVRYKLGAGPLVTATTDSGGEVHFAIPTAELESFGPMTLDAEIPSRGLSLRRPLWVATSGFSIGLETTRPTYLAGEAFEVRAATRDAAAQPSAEKLLLKVYRLKDVYGTTREELVEEHRLATGGDGTARQRLKLAEGGAYVLRVSGTDRFGKTIAAEQKLKISGDDERQRLLLLVDHRDLKAGDTAEAQIVWRGAPALALVTCRSDRLIQQRQIALVTGVNRLTVPVTAAMAPGFTLGVNVMADRSEKQGKDSNRETENGQGSSPGSPSSAPGDYGSRFDKTACEFHVDADMHVKVECHRHGGTAGVTVTTCNAQGKPVAAAVSLSVLPAERRDSAPPAGDSLSEFFGRPAVTAQFETASSIQFHYQPTNRALRAAGREENAPPVARKIFSQRGIPAAARADQSDRSVRSDRSSADDPFGADVPAKPAPKQSKPVARVAADDDSPFGEPAQVPAAKQAKQAAASPFDDDTPVQNGPQQPAENPAPALRKRNRAADSETAVARFFPPTWPGYWNPAIATGPDGRAVISVALPQEAEDLVVAAKAITSETLVGQVAQDVPLKRGLSAVIHLPPFFTDGDVVELPVVVQNQVVSRGTLEVTLDVNFDGLESNYKKVLEVKSYGRLQTRFKTTIRQLQRPAREDGSLAWRPQAVFTLTVKAGGQSDVYRRSVPILPDGVPCQVTATGVTDHIRDTTVTVAPTYRHWFARTLQIAVSPNIRRSLMDIVAAEDGNETATIGMEGLPAAGDLMTAVALTKLYDGNSPERKALDRRIRTLLSLLIATQDDGGWLIDGRQATLADNALVHWSLVLADKAGYEVPKETLDASLKRLRAGDGGDEKGDLEGKAIVLHALAIAGQGDFAVANHLLRDRTLLSPLGRAYLALALLEMGRKDTAAEVLSSARPAVGGARSPGFSRKPAPVASNSQPGTLGNGDPPAEDGAGGMGRGEIPPDGGTTSAALTALALLHLDAASPQAKTLIEAVLGHRSGLRWRPERATGPAVLAVTAWLCETKESTGRSRLAITVNGKPVKILEIDPQGPTQTIEVPMKLLVKGKQKIRFEAIQGVRLAYRCTLGGIAPAEAMAAGSSAWSVRRSFEPGPMEVDEQAVPRGFTALSGSLLLAEFHNRMTQLPAARRGIVRLQIAAAPFLSPSRKVDESADKADWLIIEPLPSGATLVPGALEGCFDRAEILPDRIVFLVPSRAYFHGSIRYELEGVFPGAMRIGPTRFCRAGRDAPLAVGRTDELAILSQGMQSSDPYRLSPDELFYLGALHKRQGDLEAARRYYTELLESWHGRPGFGLSEAAYKQTIFALMELGMGHAAPAKLVQYCEVIKERWPGDAVTLDQLLTAAGAYREIGEIERSYMACRAAVEGSFTRESGIAGFLDDQGEFLRSVNHMNRLMRDYPPESYVAEAELDLAQRVYAKAGESPAAAQQPLDSHPSFLIPHPSSSPPAEPEPQRPLTREALIERAWQKLEAYLTGYPADATADQAAFAAANALLELKRYAEAARSVADYARRFPQSELLDSYWYLRAYCDFATGKHAAAAEMCRKVAEARHLDKQTGLMVESTNKYRAIYILGQIYESLGQRGDAVREYRRVEARIPDAQASVDYFLRKQIVLPECTTLRPGAVAEVELRFRNVARCDVKVYRVDLMKLCEAGQAVGDLSQVNLAGIRPLHEASLELGDGKDYADRVRKLALPIKKEGAYLVVCRGDDLYASGLLLVSPLEIEPRMDPAAGQIRVFVKDSATGKYLSEVQVKVVPRQAGAAGATGATDLRGGFAANCPAAAMVVAHAGGGRYAYFATSPPTATRAAVANKETREDDPRGPFVSAESESVESESADFESLKRLIEETVATKTWQDTGGSAGTAHEFPTNLSLAVSQRQEVHDEIVDRLQRDRRRYEAGTAAAREGGLLAAEPATGLSNALSQGSESPAERHIREALKEPTQLEFVETPLKDVVDYLKDLHHIEIQIDVPALKEAGVDPDTTVTKNLKGVSLRSALTMILDELQLKYVIHNEVLLITSPAKAESDEYMTTKVYPVTDLVMPDRDGAVDMQALIDMLETTVATKTWQDTGGGAGTVKETVVNNRAMLVVSQSQEVHEEIEETLALLRKAGGLKAAADGVDKGRGGAVVPPRPLRIRKSAPAPQGPGTGMGGMMGGMGGMRLPDRSDSQTPYVMSCIPVVGGGSSDADLLGGLRGSNAANQNARVMHLKKRQEAGQQVMPNAGGGMGMGGGFF